jgi:hypothetical protein
MARIVEVAKHQQDGAHAGCPVCDSAIGSDTFVIQKLRPANEVGGRVDLLQAGFKALQALGQFGYDR